MALEHKRLIKTQLPIAAASLGAPAAGYEWHIKQIILFDNGAGNEATLFITGSGDDDKIFQKTLTTDTVEVINYDYPLILSATEGLYGVADLGAAEVNIMVFGAERATA